MSVAQPHSSLTGVGGSGALQEGSPERCCRRPRNQRPDSRACQSALKVESAKADAARQSTSKLLAVHHNNAALVCLHWLRVLERVRRLVTFCSLALYKFASCMYVCIRRLKLQSRCCSHCWNFFYRSMNFSAKRGIAIACRPSVRLSVTLVDQDHIGWKSWKLIARAIRLTPSLFVAQSPLSAFPASNLGPTGLRLRRVVVLPSPTF